MPALLTNAPTGGIDPSREASASLNRRLVGDVAADA